MKVLIVFNETKNDNPYVSTLKKALLAESLEVVCSVDDYWNNYREYDIIHFQWPESLIKGALNQEQYRKITEHIDLVKSKCKIISTCHNLEPHYSDNKYKNLLYEYIYSKSDVIIHLGGYSHDCLKNKLPDVMHQIIPHHVYDDLYKFDLEKNAARKRLGIPKSANVLLCFGSFRNDEERKMVLKAFKETKLPDRYLLAPGFFKFRKNIILGYKSFFKAIYYKFKRVHFVNHFIPDSKVEEYLCAADVLMIQRCKILNSGNLSLGFLAKKIVVGPETGNVGQILKVTGNPVFNPGDISSVVNSISAGFEVKNTNLPNENFRYAFENCMTTKVAKMHFDMYIDLIN